MTTAYMVEKHDNSLEGWPTDDIVSEILGFRFSLESAEKIVYEDAGNAELKWSFGDTSDPRGILVADSIQWQWTITQIEIED